MSTAQAGHAWTLHLSGHAHLRAADGRVCALEGIEALVLAWLALEGPTPRARLLALLWPEEDDATLLRNRLRQRLFALKRRLGAEGAVGGETLSLGPAVHWPGLAMAHDDGLLLEAEEGLGRPELARWLAMQRERQHTGRRQHLADEASRLERAGQLAEAIAWAERRVALEPLQEHAHRQLMRLHYLRGDRAAAIQAFERCERLLKDELGVRPGDETIALLKLVEAAAPAALGTPQPLPTALLRPPRLVGREAEWRQLMQAWALGQAVVLQGEGGLGKSRLLGDLAERQAQPVLHVAARPGDAEVPLMLLSRVLRALPSVQARGLPGETLAELARLLPDLGPAASTATGPDLRLENAVRAAVGAAAAQGLFALVLDDLHLADAASLELLRALLAERTLRWAAAFRPGPQPAALTALLEALHEGGEALALHLQPLGEAAIAEFCDSLVLPGLEGRHWAGPLLQRTGGNPQYMLETLKAWWQMPGREQAAADTGAGRAALPAPVSLPRLVTRRIEALSPAAVDLARCAAVAGDDFSPELAAAVLRLRPVDLADPWAELEAARVFSGDRFAHDLIAEAALASVPAPVARALHAEVAQGLAQGVSRRPVEPARLAHHWQRAGHWVPAAQACEQAASRCAAQGRRADEVGFWQAAAQAWQHAGDTARQFDALAACAGVLVPHGRASDATQALDAADAAAATPAQRQRVLEMRLAHAQITGDFDTTLRLGPQAVEVAWAAAGAAGAFETSLSLAGALSKHWRGTEAVALLERLRDWVDGPEASDEHRRKYWNALALALDFSRRFGEALQAWRTTQALARRVGSDLLGQAINNEAYTLNKMGRMAEAAERCAEALRLDLAYGDPLTQKADYKRSALGHHLRNCGRYGEALVQLQQARDGMRRNAFWAESAVVTHQLVMTWLILGQPERAHRLLDEDAGLALPRRLLDMRTACQTLTAHAIDPGSALARTDPQAEAALAAHYDAEELVPRLRTLLLAPTVAPAQAEAGAVQLAAWFAARQHLGHALSAHLRAARAALALHAPERADPHVLAAEELARSHHQPDLIYEGERFWVAAQVHQALGRAERWRATVHAARDWVLARAEGLDAPLRPAFLERQPVNVDLLRWAAQAG